MNNAAAEVSARVHANPPLPPQLPTQLYTAVLYTLITVLLFAQHVWYSSVKPRLRRKVWITQQCCLQHCPVLPCALACSVPVMRESSATVHCEPAQHCHHCICPWLHIFPCSASCHSTTSTTVVSIDATHLHVSGQQAAAVLASRACTGSKCLSGPVVHNRQQLADL